MNGITTVNRTELNQSNKQQHKQLTDLDKLNNRVEGHVTVFQMMLEKVLEDGGFTNAKG
jgi:hypothetical protein